MPAALGKRCGDFCSHGKEMVISCNVLCVENGVFLQHFFILLANFGYFRRNRFFAFIGSWDSQFTKCNQVQMGIQ